MPIACVKSSGILYGVYVRGWDTQGTFCYAPHPRYQQLLSCSPAITSNLFNPSPPPNISLSPQAREQAFQLLRLDPDLLRAPEHTCDDVPSDDATWPRDAIKGSKTAAGTCMVPVSQNVWKFFTKSTPTNVWTRPASTPTWLTLRFPIPDGAAPSVFDLLLDTRYPPRLHGGLPPGCADKAAEACTLCVEEPWDRTASAGYHILLGITGRPGFRVLVGA